jgi:dTDP-4-amino-4,6-dideoxygalactose transaminase
LGDFPAAEKAARETLALPISHEINKSQMEYVVNMIHQFFLGE